MSQRPILRLALLACCATLLSCAAADAPASFAPGEYAAQPLQSAARMGLHPAYRAFYDALEGEGDWVLIEPYGWVFRPQVNFDAWRPYQQGWWEPSEYYGWIWNSTDTFGWVTDHYGSWFYDPYQGWVWQPGPVWGPAWVAWVAVGDYVGWAPLAPADYDEFARIPGSVFTYAPASQFGSMHENSAALFVMRPPRAGEHVTEISNFTRRSGVVFNRGPDFDMLQRLGSPIPVPAEDPEFRRVRLPAVDPPGESELLVRTKRLVAVGVHELSRERVGAPVPVQPAPKPPVAAPPPAPVTPPAEKPAPPDSVKEREARRPVPRGKAERPRRPAVAPGHRGAGPDSTKG